MIQSAFVNITGEGGRLLQGYNAGRLSESGSPSPKSPLSFPQAALESPRLCLMDSHPFFYYCIIAVVKDSVKNPGSLIQVG